MRKQTLAIGLAVLVASAGLAFGGEPATKAGTSNVSPPARPVALTASQFAALQAAQSAPEHARALNTSATYSAREESLQFTRFSDDMWTVIYDVGWPGTYLGVLLCAL